MRKIVCQRCGISVFPRGTNQKYCVSCAPIATRETTKRRTERRDERRRREILDRIIVCSDCSTPIIAPHGLRQRCKICSPKVARAKMRLAQREQRLNPEYRRAQKIVAQEHYLRKELLKNPDQQFRQAVLAKLEQYFIDQLTEGEIK